MKNFFCDLLKKLAQKPHTYMQSRQILLLQLIIIKLFNHVCTTSILSFRKQLLSEGLSQGVILYRYCRQMWENKRVVREETYNLHVLSSEGAHRQTACLPIQRIQSIYPTVLCFGMIFQELGTYSYLFVLGSKLLMGLSES